MPLRDVAISVIDFRFNNWNKHYLFRDTLLRLIASHNLEYKDLVKDS